MRIPLVVLPLFALLASCGPEERERELVAKVQPPPEEPFEEPPEEREEEEIEEPIVEAATLLDGKIEIEGELALALKPATDGAKLVDDAGAELARYTWRDGKCKIKDASDAVLGQITGGPTKWKLENADRTATLFAFQRQSDGDWKLEDGSEGVLVKVERRDYGWRLEDTGGNVLGKVKPKGDGVSVRGPDEETRFSTKDGLSPLAAACLALDQVELELRLGLLFVMQTQTE